MVRSCRITIYSLFMKSYHIKISLIEDNILQNRYYYIQNLSFFSINTKYNNIDVIFFSYGNYIFILIIRLNSFVYIFVFPFCLHLKFQQALIVLNKIKYLDYS